MFQDMLNASRAVLLRPSVSTFEEHERNDLGAATVYIMIGAVIAAVLNAIAFAIQGPMRAQQLEQLEQLPPEFQNIPMMAGQSSLTASIATGLLGTLIGFFIWIGLIYLLGRAFGGTGAFGELAYDNALFSAPLSVVSSLIGIAAIGPLACVTGIVSLLLLGYNIYLSYLSVQAGMNLPGNKALMVILIPVIVLALGCCGIVAILGAAIGGMSTAP